AGRRLSGRRVRVQRHVPRRPDHPRRQRPGKGNRAGADRRGEAGPGQVGRIGPQGDEAPRLTAAIESESHWDYEGSSLVASMAFWLRKRIGRGGFCFSSEEGKALSRVIRTGRFCWREVVLGQIHHNL